MNGHRSDVLADVTGMTADTGISKEQANGSRAPAIVRVACRFTGARNRPALFLLLGEGDLAADRLDVPITRRIVDHVMSAVGDDRFHDLDLVINSSGGDIHATYRMIAMLRGRMIGDGELAACVPQRAQSSATLLCLGTDRILLGELGALGPLDAQIHTGVTDAGTPDFSSALHLLKALNRLQDFALDTFVETVARLYEHRAVRPDDLLRCGIDMTRVITAPLFERIESHRVGYWDQMLKTGEAYGRRLLCGADNKLLLNPRHLDRDDLVQDVLHDLVYGFASHESVLGVRELAGELGLRAELLPRDLLPIAHEFSVCSPETLIMLVSPADDDGSGDSGPKPPGVGMVREGDRVYRTRLGLYLPRMVKTRNPWRRENGKPGEYAPASQFMAGAALIPGSLPGDTIGLSTDLPGGPGTAPWQMPAPDTR